MTCRLFESTGGVLLKTRLLTAALVVCALLVTLVGCGTSATPTASTGSVATSTAVAAPSPAAVAAVALEVAGKDGSKKLSLEEVKKLPATEGYGGIKSSTGKISLIGKYKGVSLDELFKLVGGFDVAGGVALTAKDGYEMTMSGDQIAKGQFIAYDPATGDEKKIDDKLTVILAYERDGKALDKESDGDLRLVIVGPKNNQVTDGHWWVKWINKATLKSLSKEWTLKLSGVLNMTVDRSTFESGAAPGCHGASWKDDKGQEWAGVPLYLLIGFVDDQLKHDTGAYSRELADKGYTIDVIAGDGFKVTIDSKKAKVNKLLIVANKLNGSELADKNWPLRLVGPDIKSGEMVGNIVEIRVNPPQ